MKLSIITVTYNNEETISNFLNSLKRFLPVGCEIIIFDNCSEDKTKKLVKKFKVKLIESGKNLGFSKANNLASKKAKGKYLFFLNPDTEIKSNIFEEFFKVANSEENWGIIVPRLIQSDGRIQPSVRKLPTILGAIKEYYLHIPYSYEAFTPKTSMVQKVESAYGAAMFIRKELFFQVGGFDEKYFMYYEDLDLCKKIREKKLKILYDPRIVIHHKIGGSTSSNKLLWLKESARKYHGTFKYLLLYLILRLKP